MACFYPDEVPWLCRSRTILLLHTIKTILKKWCRGGLVAHCKNTLDKSKKNIMSLPTIRTIKKIGVGLAWWHPEEIPWLSRRRNIISRSHNNDNSKKKTKILGVGIAWWHPEEVPWTSQRIMPPATSIILSHPKTVKPNKSYNQFMHFSRV